LSKSTRHNVCLDTPVLRIHDYLCLSPIKSNIMIIDTNQVLVKMILDRWKASLQNWNEVLTALSDEQLEKPLAPGRNRGTYLLGHLTAVHDHLFPLLGFGDKMFPHLGPIFVESPDNHGTQYPPAKELRMMWNDVMEKLNTATDNLTEEAWFDKHTSVSAEDFAKEPHRNKLNVLLTRTTHLNYHTGQLILLNQQKSSD
jgi:hypothetical protein